MKTEIKKKSFTVDEVAKMTTLSKPYLRNKIRDGSLLVKRFGRRVVILSDDLDKFLERGVENAKENATAPLPRKKLLTARELAEVLDLPVDAIWRNAREGRYPFTVRPSPSVYRFDPDGLEVFIKQGGVVADSPEVIPRNSTEEAYCTDIPEYPRSRP